MHRFYFFADTGMIRSCSCNICTLCISQSRIGLLPLLFCNYTTNSNNNNSNNSNNSNNNNNNNNNTNKESRPVVTYVFLLYLF